MVILNKSHTFVIMDKKQNLENLIFDIFDKDIEGVDVYHYNGTEWLIFTEEKKWVTEFTDTKTLWYNYQHFNELLVYFGMDAIKSAEYIKKWYEERFIFKPKVENTIQNGVKHTSESEKLQYNLVENTIQNGVKHTLQHYHLEEKQVENTIQNGVKHTFLVSRGRLPLVENTIQNGVKSTFLMAFPRGALVENTIQNGVKHISSLDFELLPIVENTIQNGVKHILDKFHFRKRRVKRTCKCQDDQQFLVENTIQNGVKDTINIM